jgi:hypothetical protein
VDDQGRPLPLISWHEYACKEEKRLADARRDKFKLRSIISKNNNPEVVKKHVYKKKNFEEIDFLIPLSPASFESVTANVKQKVALRRSLKFPNEVS